MISLTDWRTAQSVSFKSLTDSKSLKLTACFQLVGLRYTAPKAERLYSDCLDVDPDCY